MDWPYGLWFVALIIVLFFTIFMFIISILPIISGLELTIFGMTVIIQALIDVNNAIIANFVCFPKYFQPVLGLTIVKVFLWQSHLLFLHFISFLLLFLFTSSLFRFIPLDSFAHSFVKVGQ